MIKFDIYYKKLNLLRLHLSYYRFIILISKSLNSKNYCIIHKNSKITQLINQFFIIHKAYQVLFYLKIYKIHNNNCLCFHSIVLHTIHIFNAHITIYMNYIQEEPDHQDSINLPMLNFDITQLYNIIFNQDIHISRLPCPSSIIH